VSILNFLWRIWKWKENGRKKFDLPQWDLNPGFLNKFLPTIWILREIRSIELKVLKKSWLYYSELLNHGSEFYTIFFIRKQTPAARNSTYMLYFIYWARKKKMRHFRLCLHDAHMQNVQKCAASQNATMAHWGQKLSNKTLFLKSTYNTPEISRGSYGLLHSTYQQWLRIL
jgi:hypothetical protein